MPKNSRVGNRGRYLHRKWKNQAPNTAMRGLTNARSNNFRPLGSTNKFYHSSVPRTLQIATRRPMSATLRFVKNYTIKITPSLRTAQQTNPNTPQITNIQFRANSLNNIVATGAQSGINKGWVAAGATDFEFQDGADAFTSNMRQDAEGRTKWNLGK